MKFYLITFSKAKLFVKSVKVCADNELCAVKEARKQTKLGHSYQVQTSIL